MTEREMSLTETRANLTDLVNRAEYSGETTIITRHGRPSARIAPLEDTMVTHAAENEIASHNPGRGVPAMYPLLERVTDRYDLDRETAHDAIHAYLSQIVSLDGEDAVILSRRPIEPRRVEHNPNDLDIHYWLTVDADALSVIEDGFSVEYAGSADSADDDR